MASKVDFQLDSSLLAGHEVHRGGHVIQPNSTQIS
jgi:hypothetical protein